MEEDSVTVKVIGKGVLPLYPILCRLLLMRNRRRNRCARCVRISGAMLQLWLIMLLPTLVNKEALSGCHSITRA